jgi:tRNA pseudouridine38-40 synthase
MSALPPPPAADRAVRVRLLIAYDGAGFRGFADQPGQRTVAGELMRGIATVVRHRVTLTCAGRTDAGVHARGQVAHVDLTPGVDLAALARSVNRLLAPAIVVRGVEVAPPGFDARRSARNRRYRYLVHESPVPDPLLSRFAWAVDGPLDLRAMLSAADTLLGEHDFRAFCRRVPGTAADEPIVRRVLDATWSVAPGEAFDLGAEERLLRFDILAQSFCHQMVRSLVGALVEVGRGRMRASDVQWYLTAPDRSTGAPPVAPPHGLCLLAVEYDT